MDSNWLTSHSHLTGVPFIVKCGKGEVQDCIHLCLLLFVMKCELPNVYIAVVVTRKPWHPFHHYC